MENEIRDNLPTFAAVTVIAIATCAFAFVQVGNNAGSMNASVFSMLVFVIPSVIMIVASFIVMATARRIGRNLYLLVMGTCFALGIVLLVGTSMWITDPEVSAQLLANSPDGYVIVPPMNAPLLVMRNIAASVVCPTVGSILGAWIGSRIHPVSAERGSSKKR